MYGGFPDYAMAAAPAQPQLYGQIVNGGGQLGQPMVPQYVERLSGHGNSHHSPAGSSSTCTLRQIPTTILELAQASQEPVAPERRARGDRGDSGARPREHKESRNGKSRKSGVEQDFDSWDYVYKHLEQTGYTKDQAERPDVLESSQSDEELRRNIQDLRINRNGDSQQRHHNGDSHHRRHHREESHHGQHRSQRHSRVETSESEQEQDNSRYSSAVSEDTLQPRQARHVTEDTSRRHRHAQEEHHQPQRQPRGGGQHQPQAGGRAELWECSTCTFHNRQSSNICEMCSKSRDFRPEPEERHVEPAAPPRRMSGPKTDGAACSKCTLVNPFNNKVCDACGATLPKNV